MIRFKLTLALIALAAGAPAIAGPNAFWMFGFDWRYNHGTGGRAGAHDAIEKARTPIATGVALASLDPGAAAAAPPRNETAEPAPQLALAD